MLSLEWRRERDSFFRPVLQTGKLLTSKAAQNAQSSRLVESLYVYYTHAFLTKHDCGAFERSLSIPPSFLHLVEPNLRDLLRFRNSCANNFSGFDL